ncbi:uncharacterized protein [Cicer arietinum]|uniref:Uncharacterized protein LOC101493374 n=1 Tax=Cicer arietinum TaxID=3827 RepID=A0A1S2XJN2_CICAR|nr:uncharacterized protein LOC101493374 [Cicer arietinum]
MQESNVAEDVIHKSIESHSIPSEIEAEEEPIEKNVEPKRVRGPTRMLDVWEMEDGDVIIVRLDNHSRPIGNEATTLTRFIGSVSKFEFVPPINDSTREMIKFELNEKWRQWKSDLKSKAYDPSKTKDEVATAIPDDRVDQNQYRDLVHGWFSNEGQKVSQINRQNRAKFEDVHCMGTKSLPKFIDEKIKKSKGVVPRREEIYVETRTHKDGSIVNEKAARVIEELSRYSNEVGTSQSLQNTQGSVSWKNDLFSQVQDLLRRDMCDVWIPDASSAPNNLNSPSSNNNEDNEKGED